jgi:hypothetical protein
MDYRNNSLLAALLPLALVAFELFGTWAFDPYWYFYLDHPWIGLLEALEVGMSISIIVMAIRLPLRHFGIDRRKDKLLICFFIGFIIIAAVIMCYLVYFYSSPLPRK